MLREKVQLGLFSFAISTRPFIEDNREYLYKRSENNYEEIYVLC